MTNILQELFENKKVALVGPAKYMTNLALGKEIDSHDTVVRINRSWESISSHNKNIGSRTDVLYSCLIEKPAKPSFSRMRSLFELRPRTPVGASSL